MLSWNGLKRCAMCSEWRVAEPSVHFVARWIPTGFKRRVSDMRTGDAQVGGNGFYEFVGSKRNSALLFGKDASAYTPTVQQSRHVLSRRVVDCTRWLACSVSMSCTKILPWMHTALCVTSSRVRNLIQHHITRWQNRPRKNASGILWVLRNFLKKGVDRNRNVHTFNEHS